MTTYNTGNSIGSTSPKDLYDNAENFDELVNSQTKTSHPDRLGVDRLTWHGIEQRFAEFLANSGYAPANGGLNDYDVDSPFTINSFNEYVIKDGVPYRLSPENATVPYQTNGNWAEQSGDFVAVGDEVLRQEITGDMVDGNGALLVTGATIYRDTIQDLNALPAASLVDGKSAIVQGAEYRWNAGTQEWVNVSGWISPKAWGIQASGDETEKLQAFCQYAIDNHLAVDWGDKTKTYEFSRLDFQGGDVKWYGDATLYSNKTVRDGNSFHSDVAIAFDNPKVAEIQVTSDINIGDTSITLSSTAGIEPGDILHLESTRLIATDHRGQWHEGEVVCVREVNGLTVELEDPISYYAKANDVVTGTVTNRITGYILELSNQIPGFLRDQQRLIRITTGDAAGESRYILATNGDQVRHSGGQPGEDQRGAWPAGVVAGVGYEAVWGTTAHHYKKASIRIEGSMHLTRDPVTNASPGDFSFRGMRVQGYNRGHIRMDFSNFAETNLHLSKDYKSDYKGRTVNANKSHDLWGGTGYGVSCEVCNRTEVYAYGARNRRTVDFSGAGGYSSHCRVRYACNAGGGVAYTGEEYFPTGDMQQSVAGSHGSGLFCVYELCEGFDTYGGMNMRGRDETIDMYKHYGYGNRAFNLNYGAGLTVNGFVYADRFTETFRGADGRRVISNKPELRLQQIAFLDFGDPFSGKRPTIMRNFSGSAPSVCGIWCQSGSTTTVNNLFCDNWQMEATSEGTSETEFRFIRSGVSTTIDNCNFNNIKLIELDNYSGSCVIIDLANASGSGTAVFDVADNGLITIDGTHYVRVPQGGIKRIPVRGTGSTILLDLYNVRSGFGRPRAMGLHLFSLDGTNRTMLSTVETPSVSVTNLWNVEVLASYPSDASGTTSGNMGVNFNASAGFLTLTNNTGIAQTMAVSIR